MTQERILGISDQPLKLEHIILNVQTTVFSQATSVWEPGETNKSNMERHERHAYLSPKLDPIPGRSISVSDDDRFTHNDLVHNAYLEAFKMGLFLPLGNATLTSTSPRRKRRHKANQSHKFLHISFSLALCISKKDYDRIFLKSLQELGRDSPPMCDVLDMLSSNLSHNRC